MRRKNSTDASTGKKTKELVLPHLDPGQSPWQFADADCAEPDSAQVFLQSMNEGEMGIFLSNLDVSMSSSASSNSMEQPFVPPRDHVIEVEESQESIGVEITGATAAFESEVITVEESQE